MLPIHAVTPSLGSQGSLAGVAAASPTAPGGSEAATGVSMEAAKRFTDADALQAVQPYFASYRLADKLSQVMDALQPAMQKLAAERPDLATAQFDFQSDDGAIKVVSDSLSDDDKAWLTQQLNADGSLVDAVQAFHDQAVAGYGEWAGVDGVQLSDADVAQASKDADQRFGFMQLFGQFSASMAQSMGTGNSYYRQDGGRLDFSADPQSAQGFLAFYQNAKAVESGATTLVTGTGITRYGALAGSVFYRGTDALDFRPEVAAGSAGMHLTA